MELLNNAYHHLYDSIAGLDAQHIIRLVIIVGGYALLRNLAQKHLAKRQLERKVREGEQAKAEQKLEELVDDPKGEETASANAFGWGNKTRQRVKRQEKILEERIQELQKYQGNLDDDQDIAHLLED
ncbi:LAME_0H06128g1_1 [Lachancea meyersii CBS 8951]|uniref:LAME_0H06128g1_1 n=1 Tax=Lachancea meyersii CBS 8951 TaxID=1266667 RepID=A0A1G4KEI4_9SACH|nr:LAME_0H06128g1_1 [Lachancea meyersii CBS 8951]